jgi:hypothetical protein
MEPVEHLLLAVNRFRLIPVAAELALEGIGDFGF